MAHKVESNFKYLFVSNVLYKQYALPFNEPAYKRIEEDEDNSKNVQNINEQISNSDAAEGASFSASVTARYSYELDRFRHNAALVFDTNSNSYDEDYPVNLGQDIKETLEKYRFEVETCDKLEPSDITATCEAYFQRDFTDYGCLAIIFNRRTIEASRSLQGERIVSEFLATRMPSTLNDKPKIIMCQTDGYHMHLNPASIHTASSDFLIARLVTSISIEYRDQRKSKRYPLEEVIKNIKDLGDQTDLLTIIVHAMDTICVWAAVTGLPIIIQSTLKKELRLCKT